MTLGLFGWVVSQVDECNNTPFKTPTLTILFPTRSFIATAVPISLPKFTNLPRTGDVGVVSGFGLFEHESRGWTLNLAKQTGEFRVIDDASCRTALGDQQEVISPTHFCSDNYPRMCFGDIGNGLTMDLDGVQTLVGIVSVITNMCHASYPVMYTQVSMYLEWIQENIIIEE